MGAGASLPIRRVVLEAPEIRRALRRVALQILERVDTHSPIALVGVRTRGVPLAQRLQVIMQAEEGVEVQVGELDITLYRDDVFQGLNLPEVRPTVLPFEVEGAEIVLVDDVIFTGRTTRAALDALMDWGRPKRAMLAVLVDRGHRELPLHADFVGLELETTLDESVKVELTETDGQDRVLLRAREIS